MTHVAKHHSKKEGKGDARVERWVDFLVGRNTVRINDFLKYPCELIRLEVSWRRQFCVLDLLYLQAQASRRVVA